MTDSDKPMPASELAERLLLSIDQFYRKRPKLHAQDGMPPPIAASIRAVWHRPTIEAWLGRHHPLQPPIPANDPGEKPEPASDAGWRDELQSEYAPAS